MKSASYSVSNGSVFFSLSQNKALVYGVKNNECRIYLWLCQNSSTASFNEPFFCLRLSFDYEKLQYLRKYVMSIRFVKVCRFKLHMTK